MRFIRVHQGDEGGNHLQVNNGQGGQEGQGAQGGQDDQSDQDGPGGDSPLVSKYEQGGQV